MTERLNVTTSHNLGTRACAFRFAIVAACWLAAGCSDKGFCFERDDPGQNERIHICERTRAKCDSERESTAKYDLNPGECVEMAVWCFEGDGESCRPSMDECQAVRARVAKVMAVVGDEPGPCGKGFADGAGD